LNSIKEISVEKIYTIRKSVLRENIDLPHKFNGDLEKDTFHLGAFKKEELVGIVSFMKTETKEIKGNQYQLRGMATLIKVRGEGFGNLLITAGVDILREKGINVVWCNAREKAIGFYKKNGFEIVGESFNIDKVGIHYKMKRNV